VRGDPPPPPGGRQGRARPEVPGSRLAAVHSKPPFAPARRLAWHPLGEPPLTMLGLGELSILKRPCSQQCQKWHARSSRPSAGNTPQFPCCFPAPANSKFEIRNSKSQSVSSSVQSNHSISTTLVGVLVNNMTARLPSVNQGSPVRLPRGSLGDTKPTPPTLA